VLCDFYNANPASMRAGLDALASLAGAHKKVAVVGDMLELGAISADEHAAVGKRAAELGFSALIAIGERARATADAATRAGVPHVLHTDDPRAAAAAVVGWSGPGDWVLVKASRGMRLERVVDALREIG
jgi:UDP-N-acetylmuramoyl-tripeptide--D-alanyl-D-alanine ligase